MGRSADAVGKAALEQRRAETFAQWRLNDGTTGLFPFQDNVPFVFRLPGHPHFSGRQRERAVLDGIRRKLMDCKRDREGWSRSDAHLSVACKLNVVCRAE